MRFPALVASLTAAVLVLAPVLVETGTAHAQVPFARGQHEQLRPVDQSLQAGMDQLRALVEPALAGQALDDAGYKALAGDILDRLGEISRGRDFHSADGRHLQWLLGDIRDGVELMRESPRPEVKRLGLLRIAETLNFYGREYAHPDWMPLRP